MLARRKGGPGNYGSDARPKSARARLAIRSSVSEGGSARATEFNPAADGHELDVHAAKANTSTAYDYYIRALDSGRRGDSSGALADITRAIKAHPKFALAYFERGTIKHLHGDFRAAIEAYSVAITLGPLISEFYVKRAKARQDMGDFSGSFADFTRVLELGQDTLGSYVRGCALPANDKVHPTTSTSRMPETIDKASADLTMAIKLSRKRLNAQYAESYFGRALARVGLMAGKLHANKSNSGRDRK